MRHSFWPEDYYPLRKDAAPPEDFKDDGTPFPFLPVDGEGVYEIPVGPVHAGHHRAGPFPLQRGRRDGDQSARCASFSPTKAPRSSSKGRPPAEGVELAERISGDTTIGHSLAYCQALEALAGLRSPRSARAICA